MEESQDKRKAVKLAWATYLDILSNPKIEAKVRREAAKDVLEAAGELTKPTQTNNTLVLNISPDKIADALKMVKVLSDEYLPQSETPED